MMKKLIKSTVLILLLLLGYQPTNAQHMEVGAEIGYGRTDVNDHSNLKQLFDPGAANNQKLGILVSIKPKPTGLVFHSGLIYQHESKGDHGLNFISTPVGCGFEPGKKLRAIIGSGFYLRYLFLTTGTSDAEFEATKKDFQLGYFLDFGFRYQIRTAWSVFIKLQLDFDLTPLYKYSIPTHSGNEAYQNMRSHSYSIDLGFKYMIPRKKNT